MPASTFAANCQKAASLGTLACACGHSPPGSGAAARLIGNKPRTASARAGPSHRSSRPAWPPAAIDAAPAASRSSTRPSASAPRRHGGLDAVALGDESVGRYDERVRQGGVQPKASQCRRCRLDVADVEQQGILAVDQRAFETMSNVARADHRNALRHRFPGNDRASFPLRCDYQRLREGVDLRLELFVRNVTVEAHAAIRDALTQFVFQADAVGAVAGDLQAKRDAATLERTGDADQVAGAFLRRFESPGVDDTEPVVGRRRGGDVQLAHAVRGVQSPPRLDSRKRFSQGACEAVGADTASRAAR